MLLKFHSFLHSKSYQYYFDLVSVLVAKELKVRYKNSLLGYFWSLLNPIALAIIFYFAFKVICVSLSKTTASFCYVVFFPGSGLLIRLEAHLWSSLATQAL